MKEVTKRKTPPHSFPAANSKHDIYAYISTATVSQHLILSKIPTTIKKIQIHRLSCTVYQQLRAIKENSVLIVLPESYTNTTLALAN